MGSVNCCFKLLICTDFAELLIQTKTLAPFIAEDRNRHFRGIHWPVSGVNCPPSSNSETITSVSALVSLLLVGILKSGNANQHFNLLIALLSLSGGVTVPGGSNRRSDEVLRDVGYGLWLDLLILKGFSNPDDSMTLYGGKNLSGWWWGKYSGDTGVSVSAASRTETHFSCDLQVFL